MIKISRGIRSTIIALSTILFAGCGGPEESTKNESLTAAVSNAPTNDQQSLGNHDSAPTNDQQSLGNHDSAPTSDQQSLRSPDPTVPNTVAHVSTSAEKQQDYDSLAKRVLSQELIVEHSLPDIDLLPKRGPIFILSSKTTPLTASALPKTGKRKLRLASLVELQNMADTSGNMVAFVKLDLSLETDAIAVRSGVDILLPSSSTKSKRCCCSHSNRWTKLDGPWKLDPNGIGPMACK